MLLDPSRVLILRSELAYSPEAKSDCASPTETCGGGAAVAGRGVHTITQATNMSGRRVLFLIQGSRILRLCPRSIAQSCAPVNRNGAAAPLMIGAYDVLM